MKVVDHAIFIEKKHLEFVSLTEKTHNSSEIHIVPVCTLWLFNILMGNDSFIDGLPIKNGDFPWQTVK